MCKIDLIDNFIRMIERVSHLNLESIWLILVLNYLFTSIFSMNTLTLTKQKLQSLPFNMMQNSHQICEGYDIYWFQICILKYLK